MDQPQLLQLKLRLALGQGRVTSSALVFGTIEGGLTSPDKLSRDWARVRTAKKLSPVRQLFKAVNKETEKLVNATGHLIATNPAANATTNFGVGALIGAAITSPAPHGLLIGMALTGNPVAAALVTGFAVAGGVLAARSGLIPFYEPEPIKARSNPPKASGPSR